VDDKLCKFWLQIEDEVSCWCSLVLQSKGMPVTSFVILTNNHIFESPLGYGVGAVMVQLIWIELQFTYTTILTITSNTT
jgi:hypothetical protein